ncbi:ABC transporter ATP-binding protein [Nocardia sp. NPDC049220]|uniref:ABC transporter ATP-binding protein n=1 Tax=Nocardia sp. NPDC049220 TaxID=3155273 RepID=UPI0033FAA0EB
MSAPRHRVTATNSMSVADSATTGVTIECRDVCIDVPTDTGPRRIVEGLDLRIEAGEFVCVLGASGVGKTTVLRALGGLVAPTEGSVLEIDGIPVDGPPSAGVMVFQNYASSLLPWRSALANVELPLESTVRDRGVRRERAMEALRLVGLADRHGAYPAQLSGGMQQRVQIARALVVRPRVLFMDEPFGALDAMTREGLQDELLRIHARTSMTVVFITHDIEEAAYLGTRLVVLEGRPSAVGHDLRSTLGPDRDQVATKESAEYLRLRHKLYAAVRGERKGAAR